MIKSLHHFTTLPIDKCIIPSYIEVTQSQTTKHYIIMKSLDYATLITRPLSEIQLLYKHFFISHSMFVAVRNFHYYQAYPNFPSNEL